MAGPRVLAPGRVRLLEPPGSSRSDLQRQLAQGTYDKPFIVDCGPLRFLHFAVDNVQSVMRHDEPDELCLAYTRKMMTLLLFAPDPRRVLLLGLGGGSLAKFCYRHLPLADITVLEIDPNVIALREEFCIPPDDKRFRIVQADAVSYIARMSPRMDAILVDACDRNGLAPAMAAPDLYARLRRRLAIHGVLSINICGEPDEVEDHLARIRGVFGERIICLPAREDGNTIVLAFRNGPLVWDGMQLDRHARQLGTHFGLDFPRYARHMIYGSAPPC
jgi:spermidine synthase